MQAYLRNPCDVRSVVKLERTFFQMMDLAANIVDQLTIAYDAVWVGVVVFGTDATISIPLGT